VRRRKAEKWSVTKSAVLNGTIHSAIGLISIPGVDMREPFEIVVSDEVLKDLQNRLTNTRLPPDRGIAGWSDGVEPAYLADLITYWRTGYDWRAQERSLNQFHHFRATVDSTRLHFIHERGVGPSPIPLVLTHGRGSGIVGYNVLSTTDRTYAP
jgi:hypothetical protein